MCMLGGGGIGTCVCWGVGQVRTCVCVCVHVCKCVRWGVGWDKYMCVCWGVGWDKYMCVCVCMSANQSVQLVHVPLSSWHNAVL